MSTGQDFLSCPALSCFLPSSWQAAEQDKNKKRVLSYRTGEDTRTPGPPVLCSALVRVAVAVFLAKLSLGLSNRVLAVLFNLENKRVVSHIKNQVRKALIKSFVPYRLGLKHITRETAIEQHQTAIAAILHTNKPNQLCIIADTTYLFIQKSSNNQLQGKSYSMHKHRNLVKPMVLTVTVSLSSVIFS